MLPRGKCQLGLKWSDKKERQINSKGCRARVLVSMLGGYTEYESLHAYRSSDTCRNFVLPLGCSASTWDWMWLSAWDLARLKTAQWHFPVLQCTDRTALIAIDTYFSFSFIAFRDSLLQQQCKIEHKDNRVQVVSKNCRAIVMKSLRGRLCLQGRTKERQKGRLKMESKSFSGQLKMITEMILTIKRDHKNPHVAIC